MASLLGYANNLMWLQQKLFFAAMESDQLYRRIKDKGNKDVKADGGFFYVKESAVTGFGYGMRPIATEGGAIPPHRDDTAVVPTWGLKTYAFKVQITGPAVDAGNLISSVDIQSVTMQAAQQSMTHFLAYDLRGSEYGHLARATNTQGAPGGTSLVVDDATPFRPGMSIDCYSAISGGVPNWTDTTITGVDLTTNTLTLAEAKEWTAGDFLFYNDCYGNMQNGLAGLLADTTERTYTVGGHDYYVTPGVATYAGLARSSTANWTSFAQAFSGATFDIKYVEDFLARCANFQHRSNGPNFTAIYASPSTIATLLSLVPYSRRLGVDNKVVFGSENTVSILSPFVSAGKLDVIPVLDWWKYSLWFINEKDLRLRWPVEPGWVRADGRILVPNHTEVNGYDTYTATWITRWALIGHPIEHALFYGIPDVS